MKKQRQRWCQNSLIYLRYILNGYQIFIVKSYLKRHLFQMFQLDELGWICLQRVHEFIWPPTSSDLTQDHFNVGVHARIETRTLLLQKCLIASVYHLRGPLVPIDKLDIFKKIFPGEKDLGS